VLLDFTLDAEEEEEADFALTDVTCAPVFLDDGLASTCTTTVRGFDEPVVERVVDGILLLLLLSLFLDNFRQV